MARRPTTMSRIDTASVGGVFGAIAGATTGTMWAIMWWIVDTAGGDGWDVVVGCIAAGMAVFGVYGWTHPHSARWADRNRAANTAHHRAIHVVHDPEES